MKRAIFIGIILTLLIGIFEIPEAFYKKDETNPEVEALALIEAFESSQTDFIEFNINATLHIKDEFFNMYQLEDIKEILINELELKGEIKDITSVEQYNPYLMLQEQVDQDTIYIHKNEDVGSNEITVTSIDTSGKMMVIILYSAVLENESQSNIIIDIVENKGYKDIGKIILQQRETLERFGEDIEITTTIVGAKEGRLLQSDKEEWLNAIIKTVKAQKIEEVKDEFYTSITLFSPQISKAIQYNGKTVNLQLATRYNQYEDKTYLLIATPLITNTY